MYEPKNIFSFSIELKLLIALKEFCRKEGISASSFIRGAIKSKLEAEE